MTFYAFTSNGFYFQRIATQFPTKKILRTAFKAFRAFYNERYLKSKPLF